MNKDNQIIEFKVEKLWGLYNFNMKIENDVTILIGKNGSGKSTLLNLLSNTLEKKHHKNNIQFDSAEIIFKNNRKIRTGRTSFSFTNNEGTFNDKSINSLMEFLESMKKDLQKQIEENKDLFKGLKKTNEEDLVIDLKEEEEEKEFKTRPVPKVIKFSTFDMDLKNKQLINSKDSENEDVKTELDLILFNLINDFKLYQLKIKNILDEESENIDAKIKILSSSLNSSEKDLELLKKLVNKKENHKKEIYRNILNFKEILTDLFKDTNKKIDIDENNSLIFKINETVITPYNLSSGEKQILSILLTVLLTEEVFCYLIMDEPEISLHVEWQSVFIDNLKKLNKNMQIIIATHSPAIVTKGWKNNIIKMKDITFTNGN